MLLPQELDRLRVVLVSTRNPLNIGAAARAMSNFGCLRLRVVNPYEAAFRNACSAVGAAPLLASAEEFTSVAEAVADCTLVIGTTTGHSRELHHPLRRLQDAAPVIRERLASGRVAILFGSEKRGLSNQDFSYCNWLMHIPTREEHLSMNLGQAVAVCLYELVRDEESRIHSELPALASEAEIERITSVLSEGLRISGYTTPQTSALTDEKLRRMIRRLNIPASDADVWLGMLRQILWKMKAGEKVR